MISCFSVSFALSRPTRARGLKHNEMVKRNVGLTSRPTRARGLKLSSCFKVVLNSSSRPTRARVLKLEKVLYLSVQTPNFGHYAAITSGFKSFLMIALWYSLG